MNATVTVAGMVMASPVWGLRPGRSARLRLVNVPKAGMVSFGFSLRVSLALMK